MMATAQIHPSLLISHLRGCVPKGAKLSTDSRQIQSGDIFFAYPVGHGNDLRDGRLYINAALANGAAAVVYDPAGMNDEFIESALCFPVEQLAKFVGGLCAEWYEYPSKQLQVIGITGTNGKTSIAYWLAQTLNKASYPVAMLGTLGAGFLGKLLPTGYTTPDAPQIQRQLNEFALAGAKQAVMEVSSHALDQNRIDGVEINCAVFTNLSQDHLDYHGTMAEYAQVKARLFRHPGLKHAVINLDDSFGRELAMQLLAADSTQVWGYAVDEKAFAGFEIFGKRLQRVFIKDIAFISAGYQVIFCHETFSEHPVQLPVLGEFNLSNCLAVWTALLTQGISAEQASKRIAQLQAVPGRMELIPLQHSDPLVVVDYAHTPDALQKALLALSPLAKQRGGKLWCVFGCGGNRDVGKRPHMGKIAQTFADQIIITSDNPRAEDPEAIIAMIHAGMTVDSQHIHTIIDRAAAIMSAVRGADSQDIVLVAGKGHESSQEIQGKKFSFSDQEHVQLAARGRA
jgi:UDP-N-acetylmuramoyl-L-alanyl-D-glutamate--2,6-diaminopimelate ligase